MRVSSSRRRSFSSASSRSASARPASIAGLLASRALLRSGIARYVASLDCDSQVQGGWPATRGAPQAIVCSHVDRGPRAPNKVGERKPTEDRLELVNQIGFRADRIVVEL